VGHIKQRQRFAVSYLWHHLKNSGATVKALSMRDQMPVSTAFVDAFRAVFGASEINQSIKASLTGLPTFYASENGHTIGTPQHAPGFSVSGSALMIRPGKVGR